jgi:hypothetical protein
MDLTYSAPMADNTADAPTAPPADTPDNAPAEAADSVAQAGTAEGSESAADQAAQSGAGNGGGDSGEAAGKAAPAAEAATASPTTTAAAAPEPAPEPKPVVIPEALRGCVDKIHETLQNDLDDRELVKVLKKHVRQLKEWDQWSEHARNAYAHLIAAEIIHGKAASICIDNGIEFEKNGKAEYEHLLRAVQKRTPR